MGARSDRLRRRVRDLVREEPGLTLHEAARKLSLSDEAVLRALAGRDVLRVIRTRIRELIGELGVIGPCRVEISSGPASLSLDLGSLALAQCVGGWRMEVPPATFSISDPGIAGAYVLIRSADPSIEFLNKRGRIAFRVVLAEGSDRAAFERLVRRHAVSADAPRPR